ncbi:hypothetical protein CGCS363_v012627 [Colletotrichum siamense]|uniref:uncharacterized protein n=1 Tax=Colletotrichum siamense TaxID=690259 RepID=UPI00187294CE|nr:uncharacterized protein CGCS363_v012627 [Colletotrichum siamense]KAF5489983.1 hypothetical protein CGCS363_v012627 [Colletotrichum siamense]
MSLEDSASSDPITAYAVGTTLTLLPHMNLATPYARWYGWREDKEKPESAKNVEYHPSNYTPPAAENKSEQLSVQVLKVIHVIGGEFSHESLRLVCKVLKAPSTELDNGERLREENIVVAEVFDHMLYATLVLPFAPVLRSTYLANSEFYQTAGVYKRLHSAGEENVKLTGPSQMAPEYHGSWVIQHLPEKNDGSITTRYVGAVLREHVEGPSIESVCYRHERDGLFPLRKIRPHKDLDREISLEDRDVRLDIMKQIIHGLVVHKKYHIEHEGPEAKNYVITLRRNGEILEKPQAVQVNFGYTYLWDLTIWAKSKHQHHQTHLNIPKLPHPIHPIELYDFDYLTDFAGWTPWHWTSGQWFRKGTSLMHKWFLRPDVFGPKQEGPNYSLFATLQQEEGLQDEQPATLSNTQDLGTEDSGNACEDGGQ